MYRASSVVEDTGGGGCQLNSLEWRDEGDMRSEGKDWRREKREREREADLRRRTRYFPATVGHESEIHK